MTVCLEARAEKTRCVQIGQSAAGVWDSTYHSEGGGEEKSVVFQWDQLVSSALDLTLVLLWTKFLKIKLLSGYTYRRTKFISASREKPHSPEPHFPQVSWGICTHFEKMFCTVGQKSIF